MSFGKAKRFNYKSYDTTPSPADYSFSSDFGSGYTIGRGPRFCKHLAEEPGEVCKRMNCHHKKHTQTEQQSKTQDIKSTIELLNDLDITASNENISESSVTDRKNRSKRDKRQYLRMDGNDRLGIDENDRKEHENTVFSVKELIGKYEQFILNPQEQYFDDDYHSFTSTEEQEELKRIDQFEFEEVCKEMMKLNLTSSEENSELYEIPLYNDDDDFEDLGIGESSGGESSIKSSSTEYLAEPDIQVNVEKSSMSRSMVEKLIREAIELLRQQFEKEKKNILSKSTDKFRSVLKEIYALQDVSEDNTKRMCDYTAKNLTEMIKNLDKMHFLE